MTKILEYCRRQHPTTPLHLIGVMEELFERGLTPMEFNHKAEASRLAQQYQASYFDCHEHNWESETTQKSVLNRIYQLEVDRFKQSLDPSQLQAYQTQNRLPDVDLRTEYDRSHAVSAMMAGLKDPAELKKRMRELPNIVKSTIEAEKLADQHWNGFWKKYEQFCARHELNQQRFNQLANDLVYLEHDAATRHDIYDKLRLLRQKIVEAQSIFYYAALRVEFWKVPQTTRRQPQFLADKPEPSAPAITQSFTGSASFFRAEPASSSAPSEGPGALVPDGLDKKIGTCETEKAARQPREIQRSARIIPIIEVTIHQRNSSYIEVFNKQDCVRKALHNDLKHPECKQTDKIAGKQVPRSKIIVDKLVTNKLNLFTNSLVTDTSSYVTATRLGR